MEKNKVLLNSITVLTSASITKIVLLKTANHALGKLCFSVMKVLLMC